MIVFASVIIGAVCGLFLGLFVGGFATIVAIAFLFGIANNEDIDID